MTAPGPTPIHYWNRSRRVVEVEKVLGGSWIQLGYKNSFLRKIVSSIFFQKVLSIFVSIYQKSFLSKSSISGFVENFSIQIDRFEIPQNGFSDFNQFFIRKFKSQFIQYPQTPTVLGSPCEARLSVFPIASDEIPITLKGATTRFSKLWPEDLLPKKPLDFKNGHVWVFRLCPIDYHRFHFFDSGVPTEAKRIAGKLGSVNPGALDYFPSTFIENERQVTFFKSDNFGDCVILEVGALCVGKIIQTFVSQQKVFRGQEKGYFEFGASTVILVTQGTSVSPDPDIIEKTQSGLESWVRVGEAIGTQFKNSF